MALNNEQKQLAFQAGVNLLKKAASVSLVKSSTKDDRRLLRGKRSSLNRRANKLLKIADGTILQNVSEQVKKFENKLLFGTRKKVTIKDKNGKEIKRTRIIVPRELM